MAQEKKQVSLLDTEFAFDTPPIGIEGEGAGKFPAHVIGHVGDPDDDEYNEEDNQEDEGGGGGGDVDDKEKEDKKKKNPKSTVKKEEEDDNEGDDGGDDEDDDEDDDKDDNEKAKKVNKASKVNEGEGGEGDEDETSPEFFKTLAQELKEKGVFTNVDIKEDDEIDEEKFFALQEQEVEARVDETFEGFFEEMDEDGAAFVKFKRNGGSTKQFFELYAKSTNLSTIDITKEGDQEKFLRNYYATVEELDEDDIDAKITFHKEGKTLEKYATKYFTKAETQDKAKKDALLVEQEKEKKALIVKRTKLVADLKTMIDSTTEVKGVPLTKKDKEGMLDFFVKPTVKTGNNKYLTGFQAALNEAMGDKEDMLILGKLLKSKFDVSDIVAKGETKKVKSIKSKLEIAKNTGKKAASRNINQGKSLADMIDE